AVLRVVVPGAEEGAVVLTAADGGTRRRALLGGEGVFVGLAGGTYTLEVLLPGRAALARQHAVAPRQRSAVVVTGEAAARAPGGSPQAPTGGGGTGPGQAQRRPPR
ncbi:MAG TPA: hypothetical protein VM617_05260, partial [Thermoanaerobaculia bacterium]|nr:hypothetical protein [Thermoanaerobaculia bacterium]